MNNQKVYIVFTTVYDGMNSPLSLTLVKVLTDVHEAVKLQLSLEVQMNTERHDDVPGDEWKQALKNVTRLLDEKCDLQSEEYKDGLGAYEKAEDKFRHRTFNFLPFCRSYIKGMIVNSDEEGKPIFI